MTAAHTAGAPCKPTTNPPRPAEGPAPLGNPVIGPPTRGGHAGRVTTDIRTLATSSADRRPARPPLGNRLMLRWLTGRTAQPGSLAALRYAARDGRTVALPVMAAVDRDRITVLV